MQKFIIAAGFIAIIIILMFCFRKPAEDAATRAYKGAGPQIPPPWVHKKGLENVPSPIPGGAIPWLSLGIRIVSKKSSVVFSTGEVLLSDYYLVPFRITKFS